MKHGKFEYWQSSKSSNNGQWYFRLRAANGKIICQSEGYRTKAGCLNGIRSVRLHAGVADVVEL